MAESLVQKLLSPSKLKIYDEAYSIQVWRDLKVSSVRIIATAQTAANPLSNEYLLNDSQSVELLEDDLRSTKVLQPVFIEINAFTESISTTTAITRAYNDVTKTFRIVSKGLAAQGMAMTRINIDQSPEMLSAVAISISFEQATMKSSTGWNPLSNSDDDTYGLSIVTTPSIAGALNSVYNKISSIWN